MRLLIALLAPLCFPSLLAADFAPARPMPAAPLDSGKTITRIAFGSCFQQTAGGGIFSRIAARQPDVFLFIGDNVYAADETHDPGLMSLRTAYGELAAVGPFESLRKTTPMLVTWDDHDYGMNDAGGDWPGRDFSESLYEYVWAVQPSDSRATRPGVYHERSVGPAGKRVQFIMLDTRSFRTPLTPNPDPKIGRYAPSNDPGQNMLGDEQWQWFERQLEKPADVRIIASSIQLIADGHYWEAWRTMPRERERFYRLLKSTDANGVIVISGDRHTAALYRLDNLYEITSSSLNLPLTQLLGNRTPEDEPGPNRHGRPFYESNYGLIDIDWRTHTASLQVIDEQDIAVRRVTIPLGKLRQTDSPAQ